MKKNKQHYGQFPRFAVMGAVVGGMAASWGGAIAGGIFGLALDASHPLK